MNLILLKRKQKNYDQIKKRKDDSNGSISDERSLKRSKHKKLHPVNRKSAIWY